MASKANSKLCQTSEMELFTEIVKKSLIIFAKISILDVWQGSEYASELAFEVNYVSISN